MFKKQKWGNAEYPRNIQVSAKTTSNNTSIVQLFDFLVKKDTGKYSVNI